MSKRKLTVEEIMQEEINRAQERATLRVAPLLFAEFNKLAKRHPKLKRVLFGNGTYCIEYGEDSMSGDERLVSRLPKSFAKFEQMCSDASGMQFYICAYEEDLKRW